ncbi:plasmid pRiA4b ORF-3 family protein [Pseudanabaena sp. UWO311]|uniref:plasmid pRiA4b ORF-3 family protein n=1 Tax=Pseudanabaena sp. UWO311 TaxID=2487337 RepID=UPI0011592DC2|nr:plasmid pRiA4b ORF-3 family protein [Pseudanabaena sp. UWO311]TYQ29043.1 plasmid pRiA4b ORF-3 family protein [Pseudanabaena sp. UWO311]
MFNLFNLFPTEIQQEKAPLSESSKQLLSKQVFTTNQPNTIVQDFETFIEFLQLHKVEVSANQNAIAPKYLADINERLSHPTKIDFQRPSQKSYPYIHGLYLLLRSSAIAQVQLDKKKNILRIDPQILQLWQELNDTEKYFNLLATWIFYAHEGIMDNASRSLNDWWYIFNFWNNLPAKGLNFTSSKDEDWLRQLRLHNVALLYLFGFIEVKDAEPLAGKGWRITEAKPLPFGTALMHLLHATDWQRGMFLEYEEELEEERLLGVDVVVQQSTPTEILQEEFQALDLFPEWEKNLQLPEAESKDGVFIFKVSLKTAWRKIAIPSNLTLYDFSSAILKAFNFDNDHLHQFTYKDRQGCKQRITHPYSQDPPSTDEVLIRDWQIGIGDRITYVFDFGDWWEFNVVLESIEEPDPKFKKAKVVDKKGKASEQYPDYDEE